MMRHLTRKLSLYLFVFSGLTACGGGGDSSNVANGPTNNPVVVNGGGVKGPLANAVVTVYAFDGARPGFKGAVVATASTDATAAITGLSLPSPVNPPYIMEFTSTPGVTTDLTTGQFPVISTLRGVIKQAQLDSSAQIYATPLTTMVVDIAVANAVDNNGIAGIQADEFENALTAATGQVVSTLGFGLDSTVDIFSVPPLIDSTTDTEARQADVAAYRAAVEAVTAVAFQVSQQVSGSDPDSVLGDLAADLADGGGIDGSTGSTINANTLQVLQQDPGSLPIPNSPSGQTVADVQAILVAEAAIKAPSVSVTALDTGGSITTVPLPAQTNPDIDGDGVLNINDAFPTDSTQSSKTDVDADGWPVGQDPDDNDATNPGTLFVDTDGDGIGDLTDTNDDNDGLSDAAEALAGTDPLDSDTDNDGVLDGTDFNPLDNTITFNFAPVTVNDTVTINEDATTVVIDVIANDTDNDGNPNDTISLIAIGTSSLGTAVINASQIEFTPNTDANGTDVISYTVSDGTLTSTGTVTVNISAVNDTPVITGTPATLVVAGSGYSFIPVGSDVDGDVLAYSIAGKPVWASFDPVTGALTGTPAAGDAGVYTNIVISITDNVIATPVALASFSITVDVDADQDGFTVSGGDCNDSDASINPNATEIFDGIDNNCDGQVDEGFSAPVIQQTGPFNVFMDEDASPVLFSAPVISATDANGDLLSWSSTTASHGVVTVSGAGASPAVFTYVPAANFNGNDSFDVIVSDGTGGNASVTVNVTVNAVNDVPTITGTPVLTVSAGSTYTFTPVGNDVDGDSLTYIISGKPAWASFDPATGVLTGTPASSDINTYPNIIISVTDTVIATPVALGAFSITVSAATVGGGAVWDNFNWDDGSHWQ